MTASTVSSFCAFRWVNASRPSAARNASSMSKGRPLSTALRSIRGLTSRKVDAAASTAEKRIVVDETNVSSPQVRSSRTS